MPRLLVLNPNTSASVTALLATHARRIAGGSAEVAAVTAAFGAPYIACEASYAVAGHAALDAWAAARSAEAFDAVLIGCFGDPGLFALREASAAPVTGLAEAAFAEAAAGGERFAVVTGGERWKPMLERLALALGKDATLAGIETVAPTGAWIAANPDAARTLLRQACVNAARRFGVRTVVLGGAGLAGIADAIRPEIDLRIVDSVEAGVRRALASIGTKGPGDDRIDVAWSGVSRALGARGRAA